MYNAINGDVEQPLTQDAQNIPRVKTRAICTMVWLASFGVFFVAFNRATHSYLFESLSFTTISSCERRMLDSTETCDAETMIIYAAQVAL